MTRIRVHNPRSMDVKYFRNYELFWDRLTDRLRRSFEVDENRPLNATSLGMSAPLKAALHGPLRSTLRNRNASSSLTRLRPGADPPLTRSCIPR